MVIGHENFIRLPVQSPFEMKRYFEITTQAVIYLFSFLSLSDRYT